MGKVYFKTATMAAGKTALACMCAYQYEEQGFKPLLIKPSLSSNPHGRFYSRIEHLTRDCLNVSKKHNLEQLVIDGTKIVIIDECQFLTKEQVNQIFYLSLKKDITFICYGLLTDFKTQMFEGSKRLIELGAIIEQIKHIDSRGERTIINAKFDANGNILTDGPVVDETKEKYFAMSLRQFWERLGVL